LLTSYGEPVLAFLTFVRGATYPVGQMEYAWKRLLSNHPHDSICGCSTDDVHRAMIPRFDGADRTVQQLMREGLAGVTPTFARDPDDDHATVVTVFNPLPVARSAVVERLLVLQPPGIDVERLAVVDEDGNAVPSAVLDVRYGERFWGVDYRTELFGARQREQFQTYLDRFPERFAYGAADRSTHDSFITIRFLARDLPAVGYRQYYVREESGEPKATTRPTGGVRAAGDQMESEHYLVRLHPNGSIDVTDKATGRSYPGLNRLEDAEDIGDEYDYAPAANTDTRTSDDVEGAVRVVEDSGLLGCLEAEFTLMLPAEVDADRQRRSQKTVGCRTRVRVSVAEASRRVAIEVRFDNRARDHRLRALFPTAARSDTIVSEGHFFVHRRAIDQPDGSQWRQPPAGTYPQQGFSAVEADGAGLAVLNLGLPEIAAMRDTNGNVTLSLTLLRAVGWLSRDDFETRRCANAGPTVATPDAQCLGEHVFQYAVVPYGGDYLTADITGRSQRFRVPPLTIQGVEDGHMTGGVGLVEQATRSTCLTAIKRCDERGTLLVRLYNLTSERVAEVLSFGLDVRAAYRVNALEERMGPVALTSARQLELVLGPHEIIAVELDVSGSAGETA
jgi:alpha-mannosidase